MTTFYRNGDKSDEWQVLNFGKSSDDLQYIDFGQGNYTLFTVICDGDQPIRGYIEFNYALDTDDAAAWQERDVRLSDPGYSMFAEWARQIIKEEQETDQ